MNETLDHWFVNEILVHEAALVRYLFRVWPNRDEVHDLRQEAYIRVYQAAAKSRPRSPKSYLFTAARNLMMDRLRRGRIVSIEAMGDVEELNVPVDEVSPEKRLGVRQEFRRLAKAFDRLPDRCREVVWLRRVEERPQKEVAEALGISQKTVEKHLAKGTRLLAGYLFGDDAGTETGDPGAESGKARTDEEDEHGQQHGD